MKDTKAREQIYKLAKEVCSLDSARTYLGRRVEKLEGIMCGLAIKPCKECGHETLQKKLGEEIHYICLNCGTEYECKTEEVCTIVRKGQCGTK